MAEKKKKNTKKKTKKTPRKETGYTSRQLAIIGVGVLAVIGIALVIILTSSRTPTEVPDITGTVEGERVLLATANGIEVYREDVQEVQQQLQMQTGQQVTEEQALEQAITMRLLVEEARNRGHTATTEDVEERLESQGMTIEEIRQLVEMQGMDYDEFLEEQKEQVTLQGLIEELSEGVEASDEQARQVYEEQVAPTQNVTYEEVEDDIKNFIREQEAIQAIQQIATQLYQNAEIEYHN